MAAIPALMKQRRAPAADWVLQNPTLLLAEIGYEEDTGRMKVGDGVTPWTGLDYFGTSPIRRTITATFNNVGAYALVNQDVVAVPTFQLLRLSTNNPCWVRLYSSAAARAADASRPLDTDPLPGSGVLAEVASSLGGYNQPLSPAALCFNSETPENAMTYVSLLNLTGSVRNYTVTLTILPQEF